LDQEERESSFNLSLRKLAEAEHAQAEASASAEDSPSARGAARASG
jgi:hypothetical protein